MKKAFQNMFTLALSALMIINMIPGNIYAEENETQINEAVQENVETAENKIEEISTEIAVQEVQTPSENKEEVPVKEETKIEEVKEEAPDENKTEEAVKEEALPENKIEEAAKEETPVLENKEEKKEELILTEAAVIMASEPMEAMNSVIEAVEEAPAKAEKIKITVNFTDILKTDGTTKTGTASSTLSKNLSSWKILQAKFNNQVTYKDFTVKGTKYHFTGEWAYEDGSPVSIPMNSSMTISMKIRSSTSIRSTRRPKPQDSTSTRSTISLTVPDPGQIPPAPSPLIRIHSKLRLPRHTTSSCTGRMARPARSTMPVINSPSKQRISVMATRKM